MLQEIHFNIPIEILKATFVRNTPYDLQIDESLDHRILTDVIYGRVIPDCNLNGGQQVEIDLGLCPQRVANDGTLIFKVPKDLTNGRSIITVLSVYMGAGNGIPPSYGDGLMGAAHGIMGYGNSAPFTANLELIGENVVAVKYTAPTTKLGVLRAIVEYAENLQGIPPRLWWLLSRLAVLATQSKVYTHMRMPANRAELYGGVELTSFSDVVSEYSNAEEEYQTLLRESVWKATYMADQATHYRHLKRLINPGL